MKLRHFVLALLLQTLLCQSVFAATNTGIQVPPNEERTDPIHFNFSLEPGETFEDSVIIPNRDVIPLTLQLIPVDRIFINGDFFFRDINETQEGVGSWVSFEENVFEVAPGESEEISFTITVPEDIAPGDYQGGFILTDAVNADMGNGEEGITGTVILTQVGELIRIAVEGDVNFEFNWTDYEHFKDKSTPGEDFRYTFDNKGNTAADVKLSMAFTNLFFGDTDILEPTLSQVLADATGTAEVQWDNAPRFGLMKLVSTLTWSRSNFGGALSEEEIATTVDSESKTLWFFIIPIFEALLALGVFLISFVFFFWRAKKRADFVKTLVSFEVKKTESLTLLTAPFNVSWKLLAKINKIPSPYVVTKGQTILLPRKPNKIKKSR